MFCNIEPIILASGSPRRRHYLDDLGLSFTVSPVLIDETPLPGEVSDAFIVRMAREKAAAVSEKFRGSWVVSGDTVVCLGSEILGKPADKEDALHILMSLSGREHEVKTGICLLHADKKVEDHRCAVTRVTFANFDKMTAMAYIDSGECLDKAGAYGIQGKGAFLVKAIKGSYSNVVGLPLHELLEMLRYYQVIETVPVTNI